jgi:ubiquinone/menaquinone biosynthesis C-methylase UbiE
VLTVEKGKSSSRFKLMGVAFKIRDFIFSRIKILNEVGLKPGDTVLDYGCGPGSYIVPLWSLVGVSGKIYALDVNPLAIKFVEEVALKNRLENVKTILSNCDTGLPDHHVDVVLLYDTYHALNNSDEVLQEIKRVLKEDGIFSFSDHHMEDKEIKEKILRNNLFTLIKKNRKTYTFSMNT